LLLEALLFGDDPGTHISQFIIKLQVVFGDFLIRRKSHGSVMIDRRYIHVIEVSVLATLDLDHFIIELFVHPLNFFASLIARFVPWS
jgi:hypothetical protein